MPEVEGAGVVGGEEGEEGEEGGEARGERGKGERRVEGGAGGEVSWEVSILHAALHAASNRATTKYTAYWFKRLDPFCSKHGGDVKVHLRVECAHLISVCCL